MNKRLNLNQGSTEWHRHRTVHANASEAPVVMGVSPWEPDTWFKLWQFKTGRAAPLHSEAPHLQRGRDLEGEARHAYEKHAGTVMQPVVMQKSDLMSASLDGISYEGDVILEIKCPTEGVNSQAWQQVVEGEIPHHYYWQLQHQLYVSGARRAHLWLFDGSDGLLTEIRPDNKQQRVLLRTWKEFWSYIAADVPPPLTDKDTLLREDSAWISAAQAYKQAKEELLRAEANAEKTRASLIKLANHVRVQGEGVSVTHFWQEGRVNYHAIEELKGIDLNRYRAPRTEQVRVSIGEPA